MNLMYIEKVARRHSFVHDLVCWAKKSGKKAYDSAIANFWPNFYQDAEDATNRNTRLSHHFKVNCWFRWTARHIRGLREHTCPLNTQFAKSRVTPPTNYALLQHSFAKE